MNGETVKDVTHKTIKPKNLCQLFIFKFLVFISLVLHLNFLHCSLTATTVTQLDTRFGGVKAAARASSG